MKLCITAVRYDVHAGGWAFCMSLGLYLSARVCNVGALWDYLLGMLLC